MKAVIVIDMPDDMEIKDTKALHITLFNGLFTRDISINCPLRPLPKPITDYDVKVSYDYDPYYAEGWNDCLAEITGETE